MRARTSVGPVGIALLAFAAPALAGYECIAGDKLPDSKALSEALAEARSVEPMAKEWVAEWRFDVPRERVAATLKASLSAMDHALKSDPENVELLLLAGLTAHYGHNVDVEGAFDEAVAWLTKAQSLSRRDYRPSWVLGVHYCQAGEAKKGMPYLLDVERSFPADQLSAPFLEDSAACAWLSGMRAHFMRTVDLIRSRGLALSAGNASLARVAAKGIQPLDPIKTYEQKEVWAADQFGDGERFTARGLGLSFTCPLDWTFSISAVKNAACVVDITRGPYQGRTGEVFPHIVILVRPQNAGESQVAFVKGLLRLDLSVYATTAAGQIPGAATYEGRDPKLYEQEGGAHLLVAAAMRHKPPYAGLVFENPQEPQKSGASGDVKYFMLPESPSRYEGDLCYAVILDTAESVFPAAVKDWEYLLQHLVVE